MLQAFLILLFGLPAQADVYGFPDREFHISTETQVQDYSLVLTDNATEKSLDYKPNIGSVFIPSISYGKYVSLSWGFRGPVSDTDREHKGDTRFTDIRFNFAFRQFMVNTFYSQYSGMFLENSSDVDPSLAGTSVKLQRSDLYSRSYGVSFTWVYNEERFSLPNLFNQAERQEKSGGSFLFGGAFTETAIRADRTLVPANQQSNYDVLTSWSGGKYKTISTKFGYGYALAHKWFLGAAVLVGPGITRRTLQYDNRGNNSGWEPTLRSEFLFSGGYNGDWFFTSFKGTAMQDVFYFTGSSSQVSSSLITVGLNVGMHLSTLSW